MTRPDPLNFSIFLIQPDPTWPVGRATHGQLWHQPAAPSWNHKYAAVVGTSIIQPSSVVRDLDVIWSRSVQ